jgi:hypothetical protein
MCNGSNLLFLKESYSKHAANLHDELISGDDVFLLHNIKKEPGKNIIWLESPEAAVTTRSSENLFSFLNQRARWISKAGSYSDRVTICLAIVTLVTIFAQLAILITGFFIPKLLPVFLAAYIIKSIPDFIILSDTAQRYGYNKIMRWFLPSQIVYPFYVLAVVTFSMLKGKRSSG